MRSVTGTSHEKRFDGIGVCQGVAIGQAVTVDDPHGRIVRGFIPVDQIESETERLISAIATAQRQVRGEMERVRDGLGAEREYILESHLLMLEDRSHWRKVEELIRACRANAEWAVRKITSQSLVAYERIADDYLRERGGDIVDVMRRLINILSDSQTHDLNGVAEKAIIVADDLLPSVAAGLDPRRVFGFVTNDGGWGSHTSIIARSINIPAVVGARDITGHVRSGETVIIDGSKGQVILNPTSETLRSYSELRSCQRERQSRYLEGREPSAIHIRPDDGCAD